MTKELPKSTYPFWARITLDNPLRRRLLDRKSIVGQAGVEKGSKVFEMGFGVGFFTEYLAEAAGEEGIVYCQDVEPKMLEVLKKKMPNFKISSNIKPMISSSAELDIPDGEIDVLFTANVFEEIEKEGLLPDTISEIVRIAHPGTKLFFMEHVGGVGLSRIQNMLNMLKNVGFEQTSYKETRFNVYATFTKK